MKRAKYRHSNQTDQFQSRIILLKVLIGTAALLITSRLFYWQVLNRGNLSIEALSQRTTTRTVDALRGEIIASDQFPLVANKPEYVMFAYKPQLEKSVQEISHQLAGILAELPPKDATEAAKTLRQREQEINTELLEKLSDEKRKWVPLSKNLDQTTKELLANLEIIGIGFDESYTRFYPEASTSAHLLGFVGHNDDGEPTGYFGLEGYYDLELRGRAGRIAEETDAVGKPIVVGGYDINPERAGRTLELNLDRNIQLIIYEKLQEAIKRYGAKSGEVTVMDPQTGAVLGMAALPAYDPATFNKFDTSLHKNPIVANTYEPGSTFKTLIMAAGIDAGVIKPDTICGSECDGPVKIGKYTIKTWNNEYNSGQTMTQVLANSDNTGMIYVARQLGEENLIKYIKDFGFNNKTGIDLQEETNTYLRSSWGDIDQATASFGQGVAVTSIQILNAVNAIANGGTLMTPQVVNAVQANKLIQIEPKPIRQVISPETAKLVTDMMVEAAHHGEAQWAILDNYDIAGKTGTAQIATDGIYDQKKTIASFVGFAPAYEPKFSMLVKLRETETSPWAAETAAPLWFSISQDLMTHFKIPPKNQ